VELAKADRIAAVELAPLNGEYHCSLGEVLFDAGVAIAKELKYSAKSCDLEIAACKKGIA
jgi:hypothetical protein